MRRKSVLYLEVADQIKEDILSGKYPVGTFYQQKQNWKSCLTLVKLRFGGQSKC